MGHDCYQWNPRSHCQTLCWCSGCWIPPGALQCQAPCAKSMRAFPGQWRNLYRWLAPMLPWPKGHNRAPLWHHISVHQTSPGCTSLSKSSVMLWSRSGRKCPGHHLFPLIRNMPQCYQACRGQTNYWVPFCNVILAKGLAYSMLFFETFILGWHRIQPSVGWSFSFSSNDVLSFIS